MIALMVSWIKVVWRRVIAIPRGILPAAAPSTPAAMPPICHPCLSLEVFETRFAPPVPRHTLQIDPGRFQVDDICGRVAILLTKREALHEITTDPEQEGG